VGAWGAGNFENDDAADWFAEFERNGVAAVVSALDRVFALGDDEYLEAPDASAAVAAAEIVASARDGDPSSIPESARMAFSSYRNALSDAPFLELARRAIHRILQQSELKGLWEDAAAPERDLWFTGMERLSPRLQ
jgi:Domain of unknown function (DUF4259)